MTLPFSGLLISGLVLACATSTDMSRVALAGTPWRLVAFEGGDGADERVPAGVD